MAIRLYSRLPSGPMPHERPELGRIAPVLPLASLAIGLGPALLLALLGWLRLPQLFAASLACLAYVLATGAMAEDALADAADGLGGGATPERRLEIMKDSRHGTYGVAALCLMLILRVTALAGLVGAGIWWAAAMWLAATVLARSAALWLPLALPAARADGLAAAAGGLDRTSFAIGLGLAAIVAVALGLWPAGLIGLALALLLAALAVAGWAALCRRLVGGQTGDLIGALQALVEIAVLAGFVAVV